MLAFSDDATTQKRVFYVEFFELMLMTKISHKLLKTSSVLSKDGIIY